MNVAGDVHAVNTHTNTRGQAIKHSVTEQQSAGFLTSRPQTKSSKRSVSPGLVRWYLARGDMISGWSVMKVGLTHLSSKKSPTLRYMSGCCGSGRYD